MVKTFKRTLSLIVAVVFVLSLIPTLSLASVAIPGTGKPATAKPWTGSNVPNERFMESLTQMYTDTVSKGATFIPITLNIAGKDWDDTTGFSETHGFQSRKISAFANTNNLPYIPLGTEMLKTYYAMAEKYMEENENASTKEAYNYVRNYFHIYAEHGTPPTGWNDFGTRTTDDSDHFNPTGANEVAKMVAKLLAESESPLGDYVVLPN
ncbi:MAG: hypothetical protein IKJ68_08000 [Clostridia bacterium]|nr:hypothetical protein [Clostridia bacterium]